MTCSYSFWRAKSKGRGRYTPQVVGVVIFTRPSANNPWCPRLGIHTQCIPIRQRVYLNGCHTASGEARQGLLSSCPLYGEYPEYALRVGAHICKVL